VKRKNTDQSTRKTITIKLTGHIFQTKIEELPQVNDRKDYLNQI